MPCPVSRRLFSDELGPLARGGAKPKIVTLAIVEDDRSGGHIQQPQGIVGNDGQHFVQVQDGGDDLAQYVQRGHFGYAPARGLVQAGVFDGDWRPGWPDSWASSISSVGQSAIGLVIHDKHQAQHPVLKDDGQTSTAEWAALCDAALAFDVWRQLVNPQLPSLPVSDPSGCDSSPAGEGLQEWQSVVQPALGPYLACSMVVETLRPIGARMQAFIPRSLLISRTMVSSTCSSPSWR